ncbi:MAG TPA: histidine ammonia-lyase [Bacteroidia bacterium]|nr:histidine ammonia-lyase [Bacteroidia bacterium]HNT79462.1 histidine ammonia-lyase [Bacteroidia bacterium]
MVVLSDHLTLEQAVEIVINRNSIKLSDACLKRISEGRAYLDNKLKNQQQPIYGINTGFGSLYNISINEDQLSQLQRNLVLSHACGIGERVSIDICRLMVLLKIHGLAKGYSGIHLDTISFLIRLFNDDIIPVIYNQGSLGASGDLAPLAHMSLPLIGEGEVYYKGKVHKSKELFQEKGIVPLQLKSKEGLALLNGTQFMSAYATFSWNKANDLLNWSNLIAAISLDAFDGRIEPFHPSLHKLRNHAGQTKVSNAINEILKGSSIITRNKKHVQDPYSFRCVPQVHGASFDTLQYCQSVFTTEINSVTDNPTIIPEDDLIISGGNFHGQPIALALDFMSLAVHELGNISERRTYQLISGLRELPSFLVSEAGLNSGFMIPQYTAAAIVSENKMLCMPSSADSIVSSNGQEDHVSMGANAAVKTLRIIQNVEKVLAIELLTAMQALQFRRPLKSSSVVEDLFDQFRTVVPFVENDTNLHELIVASIHFMQKHKTNFKG